MPNWCYNTVDIKGPQHKLRELYDAAMDGKLFDHVIPTPNDLKIPVEYNTSPEMEAQYNQNKLKHGYRHWYDFQTEKWGTKWDIGELISVDLDDDNLSLTFDTAWSPPEGIYHELTNQGFIVHATFEEPGMCFRGTYTSEDGMYSEEYEPISDED